MASGKAWNRRLMIGGGALAAGAAGTMAFYRSRKAVHSVSDGRTFHRGNAQEPQTMDSTMATCAQDDAIIGDLAVGLLTEDAMTNPVPGMALRWTMSSDGLTWTFQLRKALWSDGTQVTAEDFVYSWRRLLDPATAAPYAYYLYIVKNGLPISAGKMPATSLGVRALDDFSLEVQLEHPAPYL